MKVVVAVSLLTLTLGCIRQTIPVAVPGQSNIKQEAYAAIGSTQPDFASKPPKLSLEAFPIYGLAPMRVTLHATLNNVTSTDADFACLKEEWTFGDGAVSSETRDCIPPYGPLEASTEFVRDYVFDSPGTYDVFFTLGDDQLRSNKVTIRVLSHR